MMNQKTFYQENEYLDIQKKEMDDRFMNKKVQKKFCDFGSYSFVLDLGTGTGAQIRRNIELGILQNGCRVIGIDINKDAIESSFFSFKNWANNKGYQIKKLKAKNSFEIVDNIGKRYFIEMRVGSVYDLGFKDVDAVTALSLFEHTNMKRALKSVYNVLKPKGILYAPINYSGKTFFGPTNFSFRRIEKNLMKLFNYVAIDKQFKGGVEEGNSKCGRILPRECKKVGFKVLSYGKSDWYVRKKYNPPKNSMKMIADFVKAFYGLFKSASEEIKTKYFVTNKDIENWYNLRRLQSKKGVLEFVTTNKDILCQK
jgi:SAM-dependent methyltransferase